MTTYKKPLKINKQTHRDCFFFDAADGQDFPRERNFAGEGEIALHGSVHGNGKEGGDDGATRGWSVLRGGSLLLRKIK